MTDVCNCCGKKMPFLDIDFDYIKIDKESYRICGKCRSKIDAYNSGDIAVDEVVSESTHEMMAYYLRNIKKGKDWIENKMEEQKNDSLYDYVRQIAEDLRFIKNLIIIGLVSGFVLWIINVFELLLK